MTIQFDCPNCSKKVAVPEEWSGSTCTCPHCGTTIEAPLASAPDDEPAPDQTFVPPDADEGHTFAYQPETASEGTDDIPVLPADETPPPGSAAPPAMSTYVPPPSTGSKSKSVGIVVTLACVALGWWAADWLRTPSETSTYTRFTDPRGLFSVEFPEGLKVEAKRDTIVAANGVRLPYYYYLASNDLYALGVAIYDAPLEDIRQGRSDGEIAEDVLGGCFQGSGIRTTSRDEVNRGEYMVTRHIGSGKIEGGYDADGQAELYLLPERTFMVYVLTRKGHLAKSRNIPHFFESFTIH